MAKAKRASGAKPRRKLARAPAAKTHRLARTPDAKPPTRSESRPSRTDRMPLTSRLAQLTPERLAGILSRAERGEMDEWADLCDRMVTIDEDIRADYVTRLSAVAGAAYVIEPGSTGDPKRDQYAEPAARFVNDVVKNVVGAPDDFALVGFETATHRLLDGIGKCFGALEVPWEWDEERKIHAPRAFKVVHQRRFRWDDEWKLRLADDGSGKSFPGKLLTPGRWIVHIPNDTGTYPTISGALRVVAWAFLFKRWARQFWSAGAEAFAFPFLYATVDRGASEEIREKALEGLEKLSADHRAVIEDPTAFKLLETTVKDAGTWDGFTKSLSRAVSKALLGTTDASDAGRVGAYAAVESRRGTAIEPRIALDERAISETWRSQFFVQLLDYNRHLFDGVTPPIPNIRWTIAAKRREIPEIVVKSGKVRTDELRVSVGLDPLGGEDGAAFVDADDTTIEDIERATTLAQGWNLKPTEASLRSALARMGLQLEMIPNGAPVPKALPLAPTDVAKVVKGAEARASVGLAPFGDARDEKTVTELGEPKPTTPPDLLNDVPPTAPTDEGAFRTADP